MTFQTLIFENERNDLFFFQGRSKIIFPMSNNHLLFFDMKDRL